MTLSEREKMVIQDLQTQEETCIMKYKKYGSDAKDPVLKKLFKTLANNEQKHYDTLDQIMQGQVPDCDCNDTQGQDYDPEPTYAADSTDKDKTDDAFLATDCITSEKLVSTEYNTNVFVFADAAIRKILADIQIEEQNHAEMLYKYKMANGMN